MSGTINDVTLAGKITDDPSVKLLDNGYTVVIFKITTITRFKKDGDWQSKSINHRIKLYCNEASRDFYLPAIQKDNFVMVKGELEYHTYSDDREVAEIRCHDIVTNPVFRESNTKDPYE